MTQKKFSKLTDLQPDPENANTGTARGLSAVEESIQQFGGGRSILAERDGVVIAGNKTLDRAVEAGLEPVFVHTNGKQIVVVVRDDLALNDPKTAAKARGLAYADNRAGELGLRWDPERIKQDIADGLIHAPVFFTEDEIAAILNDGAKAAKKAGATDPDDVPPEPDHEPAIKIGDTFAIGAHRVMCGDATKADHITHLMAGEIARMVFIDPPYGVQYGTLYGKHDKAIKGDKDTECYKQTIPLLAAHVESKAPIYVCLSDSEIVDVVQTLTKSKITVRNTLVWNKNQAQYGMLNAQYKQKHEFILYAHFTGHAPYWYGPTTEVTVWDIDRATKNEFHPTQKPVALIERALTNSSVKGDLVVDLYGGSGSTVIGCETTERRCFTMELDPKHVKTIIDRWEAFTEQKAVKL